MVDRLSDGGDNDKDSVPGQTAGTVQCVDVFWSRASTGYTGM